MRSGGKGLAMISVINILMNLLQHETEKYIFIDTCKSQRHPPRIVYATKDHPCHQDTAMPDGDAFRVLLAKMLRQRVSEKAPASWKQVIFCRPARRNLLCRFGGGAGVPTGQYRSSGLYGAPAKTQPESSAADRPNL